MSGQFNACFALVYIIQPELLLLYLNHTYNTLECCCSTGFANKLRRQFWSKVNIGNCCSIQYIFLCECHHCCVTFCFNLIESKVEYIADCGRTGQCVIYKCELLCMLCVLCICVFVCLCVLCVLCRLRQRAVCYMQRRREAGKQLPVSSNQHYSLTDQRPLFSTTTGQVGKQAEVGGATRKCCFKTQSSSSPPPAAILFPIKKHSFALYQMRWSQIRR